MKHVLALVLLIAGCAAANTTSGTMGVLAECESLGRSADTACRGDAGTAGEDPPECQHKAMLAYEQCKKDHGL